MESPLRVARAYLVQDTNLPLRAGIPGSCRSKHELPDFVSDAERNECRQREDPGFDRYFYLAMTSRLSRRVRWPATAAYFLVTLWRSPKSRLQCLRRQEAVNCNSEECSGQDRSQ
jgi:hypothetical protein